MDGNDIPAPRFRPRATDIALAVGLLTRIPLPARVYPAPGARPAAYAAWAYPLIGLLVGGIMAGVGSLALWSGMPPMGAALLALFAAMIVTGAMHEDGLADCADGFWGGWTVSRRLEIMKDSQIGTYGVLALGYTLIFRWLLLSVFMESDGWTGILITCAVLSRAGMTLVMYHLPQARADGLSRMTGSPPGGAMVLLVLLSALLAVSFIGLPGIYALGAAGVFALLAARIATAKIGGQTGDVLGATQQVVELGLLTALLLHLF